MDGGGLHGVRVGSAFRLTNAQGCTSARKRRQTADRAHRVRTIGARRSPRHPIQPDPRQAGGRAAQTGIPPVGAAGNDNAKRITKKTEIARRSKIRAARRSHPRSP
ncbi:hypothetical protein WS67_01915 [Burkholderia singularis]|uniref:Uncharacterized protein n=1 Tax=Burkholderia singularis TaxID=1503053 RepID=A0A103DX40_9BURK|nr:hypothetical protein WS67_01915 [Burkholderia singularis]